jgi:phosphoribosylaminoimidazole-succinocarboxamide synthase
LTVKNEALTNLDLPLTRLASGKVREIFEIDPAHLLFVATDRISAYDVVMTQGIPDKGLLLTAMSLFWFELLSEVCPNHFVSAKASDFPASLGEHAGDLRGRSMIVERLDMLPVEFVVRGYLAGSGWKDYQRTGAVCGIPLPPGLQEAQRLPEPIFTPATKATEGHDVNITEDEAAELCGAAPLKTAKDYAIRLYQAAASYAEKKGIILADTKFEFGMRGAVVVLADEVLTPDSSRYWPADSYRVGTNPPSFDKQYLRDWLDATDWDRNPPPPGLPGEVIEATRNKYIEASERITGKPFEAYKAEV